MLQKDTDGIKKEAIWALANTTSKGLPTQISTLVQKGAINALVAMLKGPDSRSIAVSQQGLTNLLKIGKENLSEDGDNTIAILIEECNGLDALETLQEHPNT